MLVVARELIAGEMKRLYIRAQHCAMRGCLQKSNAMRPSAIFFLLHCGAKSQIQTMASFSFVSLSFNPYEISLSPVSFLMSYYVVSV